MPRYTVTKDGKCFAVCEMHRDMKVAVMDAIGELAASYNTISVEHRWVRKLTDTPSIHAILGTWHIFADDTFHTIDVVRTS